MSRFSEVTYNNSSQTAVVGAGLIWDDVYAALMPYDVNVLGGRVTGVGVAGFLLGGGMGGCFQTSRSTCLLLFAIGYSWQSNQFGLAIDGVVAYELVKPSGTIVTVTQMSDPDLFFGLKVGLITLLRILNSRVF